MVKFNNGRYEVQLPWKDPMSTIPDNYELCLKRLHSLLRRLRQNPELFEQYDKVIRDQIKNDIVQTVELPERVEGNRVHYLPHHAVVKHDKDTTKVRVVYDASAKMTGPSLNECLHVGPKVNQKILDILIRFRLHKVAIVADIEKAFLMIAVNEKDRDVLRFLWFRDITKEPLDLVVLRFARVTFGVSSSPFLLNATIRHHLDVQAATQEQLVKRLQESIYVDDILTGAEDVETAWQLYLHSKEILKTGGFNLRKFKTNDSDLQRRMTEAEGTIPYASETNDNETYAKSMLGKSQKPCMGEQKTLGLRWHMETDQFIFDLNEITRVSDATPIKTKRSITSIVSKVYDPLGILSPVVIPFKLYFKELCAEKKGWYDPLPERMQKRWDTLVQGLRQGNEIAIPRCLKAGIVTEHSSTYQLCGFGDASNKAYAAVVYLRTRNGEDTHCQIVCSKSRVSPMQELTIPRLELLSALLLARLLTSVAKALKDQIQLTPPVCYLDSKVAYHWIRGTDKRDKSWRPFVQNRVNEI